MRGRQYPEAYVALSEVQVAGPLPEVTARLRDRLREDLRDVDHLSRHTEPGQPLPGFTCAVRGRRSWDERVDAARGLVRWPRH
jgi:hypothetical protein